MSLYTIPTLRSPLNTWVRRLLPLGYSDLAP